MAEYVASRGTTALGIIGTVLGGIATAGGAGSMLSGGMTQNADGRFITKAEMDLNRENDQLRMQNAILQADQDSENKMTEVYKQNHAETAAVAEKVAALREEFWQARLEQSTVNAKTSDAISVNTAAINTLNSTIAGITKVGVPSSAVIPFGAPPAVPALI